VGLVGANGSGKSTLARLLNGLVLPDEGTVRVDGLSTETDGPAVRRRVGFVFTDPAAQLVMATPAEDVALSLRRHRLPADERRRRVEEVLDRFGLTALADASVHALSAGQRQLLALAGVLVTEPDVLVADEPTTLLDLRNTLVVARLLTALPQQLVLATHDLTLLEGFDRVLVLEAGRVVADDAPRAAVDAYRRLMGAVG
jgi:biotin transport system ATP-binding protein